MISCKSEESDGEVDNPVIEEYDALPQGGNTSITGNREYLQAGTPSYKVCPRYSKQLCETSFTPFDNEIHDILSSHSSQRVTFDEDDYDKMFLLSLLPIIRQVPEEKKLDVRIQMQQVLAMALRSSDNKWVIWRVFYGREERKGEVNIERKNILRWSSYIIYTRPILILYIFNTLFFTYLFDKN